MSASQAKRGSGRVLPRRITKIPLDIDDPLSASGSLPTSPARAPSISPAPSTDLKSSLAAHLGTLQGAETATESNSSSHSSKDLSFLLESSVYHPISSIDVPAAYRKPLPPAPSSGTPLSLIFSDMQELLQQCHFIAVAHLAAIALTSGFVKPTDAGAIFRLLSIRYSALELSGNVLLAAQESKALEDLSSSFYYCESSASGGGHELPGSQQAIALHIIPFDLRLQALRLQSIGFGEPRRAVAALYDLGMECRDKLTRSNPTEIELWKDRFEEVGIRVVNSLIDMGDLDCAKQTLQSMNTELSQRQLSHTARLVLLLIRMGEVDQARSLLAASTVNGANEAILQSFIQIADGDFVGAVETLLSKPSSTADAALMTMAKQNLAVAYLYTGQIDRSQHILESLIDEGCSFQALTINLATIYELTSDRSKEKKTELAAKVTRRTSSEPQRGFVNADFKL